MSENDTKLKDWDKQVNMVVAQNGIMETHFKSGRVVRREKDGTITETPSDISKTKQLQEYAIDQEYKAKWNKSREVHSYKINKKGILEDVIIKENA